MRFTSMNRVFSVLVARNEEKYILKTLLALTPQCFHTFLINDGSTDNTKHIASGFPDVTVIDLPSHARSDIGTERMALKFNVGFEAVKRYIDDSDFILIIGADDVLETNYVVKLLNCMYDDPLLVIASGQVKGESTNFHSPRGAGRMIRVSFFKQVNFSYPIIQAWESYLLYKAKSLGLKPRGFEFAYFERIRPESRSWRKGFGDGKSMRNLGYFWIYVMGRCAKVFIRNPKHGIAMFLGWGYAHFKIRKCDVAGWVNKEQKSRVRRLIWK